MKSADYKQGFQDAIIYIMELFESRREGMVSRGWFRENNVSRIVAILYAVLRARDELMELGPRKMDLIVRRDGRYELREPKKTEGKK